MIDYTGTYKWKATDCMDDAGMSYAARSVAAQIYGGSTETARRMSITMFEKAAKMAMPLAVARGSADPVIVKIDLDYDPLLLKKL